LRVGREKKKARKKVEISKLDFLGKCLKEFRVHPPTQETTSPCRNFHRERKPETELRNAGSGLPLGLHVREKTKRVL